MIIKCPECELQVSDKAISCPHCGYPMNKTVTKRKPRNKNNKRKRLPNGFGQISEIKNRNLRKPFRAMVTVGKTMTGRPIVKPLKPESFFLTYNDAYAALVEYNRNPYDLDDAIRVSELYDRWSTEYFPTITDNSKRNITAPWLFCSSTYDMRVKDVRGRHIKGCMEKGFRIEYRGKNKGEKIYASAGNKAKIKSLFNLMLDYALEYEVVDKNYARTFDVSIDVLEEMEETRTPHLCFTDDEMNKLWKNVDSVKFVDWIIIQYYMGWRPQELITLNMSDVDLENWAITGGMKTKAGKRRCVPIHSFIKPLIERNCDFAKSVGSDKLFNDKGRNNSWTLTYSKYTTRFKKVIEALELDSRHRPHDPRVTFVTNSKKAGIDDNAIKALVGHKRKDITESIYTDRDIEWLRTDIEKLKSLGKAIEVV